MRNPFDDSSFNSILTNFLQCLDRVNKFGIFNTKLSMERREVPLSHITCEGRSSSVADVRRENWIEPIEEASIALSQEKHNKEYNCDIYAQVGNYTATEDLVITGPGELASFESKELIYGRNVNFIYEWNQASKKLKSSTVQRGVQTFLAGIDCQIKDSVDLFDDGTSSPEANTYNKVPVVGSDVESKCTDSCNLAVDAEVEEKMMNIFVFGEKDGLRSGNLKSSATSMQIKCTDEFIATSRHKETHNKIQSVNEAVQLTGIRNSISERLRNVFEALHVLEEGIKVNEMPCYVDIRSNEHLITASSPWPSLRNRLCRYLRDFSHRRNAFRLILRYLFVLYFMLLHGAFFRCIAF